MLRNVSLLISSDSTIQIPSPAQCFHGLPVGDISLYTPLTKPSSDSSIRRRNTSIKTHKSSHPISNAPWLIVLF
ncbi:hypothetical protein C0J52_18915 [Blattella germanica]|nr:hypothetical protein C0J52_18915 [Blattella germanica]